MDCIIPGLFISSLEVAKDNELLISNKISLVVSLGCGENSSTEHIKYVSYPKILDTPESLIIPFLLETDELIASALSVSQNVLVHCVYGQSRSAAVIVSYLMHTGLSVEKSINAITEAHPAVCVNPGFLSQLYFKSHFTETQSPEYRLILNRMTVTVTPVDSDNATKADVDTTETNFSDDRYVLCKACGETLCSEKDVIRRSCDPRAFVQQHVDAFWRGYQPTGAGKNGSKGASGALRLPEKDLVALCPQAWIAHQMRGDSDMKRPAQAENAISGAESNSSSSSSSSNGGSVESVSRTDGVLACPGCGVECGRWRRRGLDLLGAFNLMDLYGLSRAAVRIRRMRLS